MKQWRWDPHGRHLKDLTFLNWHVNRGRLSLTASGAEMRRYLRQISHRRSH